MADSIGNLTQTGLLPRPLHVLRGVRAGFAVALVLAAALVLAGIVRSATSTQAFVACLGASVALLACAAILTQVWTPTPFERLALAADAAALFSVSLLVPTVMLGDWRHSDLASAMLIATSGASVWIARVATGDAFLRVETLNTGVLVAVVVCIAIWIFRLTDTLSEQQIAAGPIAVAAIAPLFSAGAASRQPAVIAVAIASCALVVVSILTATDHGLQLSIAGMLLVGTLVALRPRADNRSGHRNVNLERGYPWLPVTSLLALLALATALDSSWRWLAIASFAIGAVGTIAAQGVDIATRERLLVRLTRLNQLTASQARLDPLTRLPNRAALNARLNEEVERALRYRHPTAVLFVDVDHFKSINDLQGHEAGDRALREIGATIRSTIRTPDFVARFGGEEFVVIAPGTWSVDAAVLGRRMQAAIGDAVHHGDGRPVTVSIGIAGIPEHAVTADEVLRNADEALYRAKHGGRNRVEIGVAPENQDLRDNS